MTTVRPPARPRLEPLEPRDVPADPSVIDPSLAVRAAAVGLNQPTGIAFLGPNDFLVTEKATGKVQRVTDGVVSPTPPLDLAVNNASERGLLSIELHPNFRHNGWVYLYWTESTTGADSGANATVPLLGNRVDRFIWDGTKLTQDVNIIKLRARQADATNGAERGNHNGGKIKFGPDGKLYVMIGDNGRRGQLQNLPDGPFGNGQADDQFGGPEPDDAHATGSIFRLNDDGTTPRDNPFFKAGEERGGAVGAALQKVFAYGLRNGFGMAFDPESGQLWDAQNGDDSFSEINRIEAGANLGWVQVMGPLSRVAQFKAIETSNAIDPVTGTSYFGLQQNRWSPVNIADTPEEALARMFQVVEGAKRFDATLTGAEEVPGVATAASADLEVKLTDDGALRYKLKATGPISGVSASHFHLGARGRTGDVVAFLARFTTPRDFKKGDTIAEGTITDADVIARPGLPTPTVAELVARMRDGRIYANLHTTAHAGGEIRGELVPRGKQVSHYTDPQLSWKYEVAPVALGFQKGNALGEEYDGDMFAGEARVFLENGYLFRMHLSHNRKELRFDDPQLADKVADNVNKFDITESESLLFGRNFGIATEVMTGANGNLFVVSLSDGKVYEIYRPGGVGGHDDQGRDRDDHEGGRADMTGFVRKGDGGPGAAVPPPAPVRVSAAAPGDVPVGSSQPAVVADGGSVLVNRASTAGPVAEFDLPFTDPIEV